MWITEAQSYYMSDAFGNVATALKTYFVTVWLYQTSMFTTPGNLLEFEILSGYTGNILKFKWSCWKFFCLIYDRKGIHSQNLAPVQLFRNWLSHVILQWPKPFEDNDIDDDIYFLCCCIYWVNRITENCNFY